MKYATIIFVLCIIGISANKVTLDKDLVECLKEQNIDVAEVEKDYKKFLNEKFTSAEYQCVIGCVFRKAHNNSFYELVKTKVIPQGETEEIRKQLADKLDECNVKGSDECALIRCINIFQPPFEAPFLKSDL